MTETSALVLTIRVGETIYVGDIEFKVLEKMVMSKMKVQIRVVAPKNVRISRARIISKPEVGLP